jgi:hypothetical protein
LPYFRSKPISGLDIRERCMRLADCVFMLIAVTPGSSLLGLVGEGLGDNAGAPLTWRNLALALLRHEACHGGSRKAKKKHNHHRASGGTVPDIALCVARHQIERSSR